MRGVFKSNPVIGNNRGFQKSKVRYMADEVHAKLSPSAASRWMACPGSVHASEAFAESDDSSTASKEGTVAHSLLQTCVSLDLDPQDFLGQYIDGKKMPPVAQHMVDGVRVALDYLEEYLDTYGRDNVEVLTERHVYIGRMIGIEDELCNGTADLQLRHHNHSMLTVIDYKHGLKPVDVKDNPQLMLYTAGAVAEASGKYKKFKNVIIQPRAPRRRPTEEDEYRAKQLNDFLKRAGKAAEAALLPNAPRVAGDHCTFCKAKANCQTFRRRARAVAASEFDVIPDPEEIPDSQLNEILKEAKLLKEWISGVEARALAKAKAGTKFDDFELGWGQRKRIWQNPEAAREWCESKKLNVDEYAPRDLLTPAAMEKLLKKLKLFPKKERGSTEKPTSPIEHLIGYTVPSAALKPRKTASATDDFEEVEDE